MKLRTTRHSINKSLAFIAISSSLALDTSANLLEEVIVVAQKREQSAQEVGIAITTFTGEQLDRMGIDSSTDLVKITPGLQLNQPNGRSTFSFGLRGITQSDFSDHQESPIALYIDGVYISQTGAAGFATLDLERVEVLRGPQGTLFGRNSTGGLLNFITRKPTQESGGYIKGSYGSYNEAGLELAIGGALTESVSARIALVGDRSDGWYDNDIGDDGNENNAYAGRAQFLVDVNESTQNLTKFFYSDAKNETPQYWQHTAAVLDANGQGIANPGGTDNQGYRDTTGDVNQGAWNLDGDYDAKIWGFTNTFTWDNPDSGVSLTSITGYQDLDKDYLADVDASPNTALHFMSAAETEQFSQEFDVNGETDRARWVVGAFYLNIDGDYSQNANVGGGGPDLDYTTEVSSWAAFFQYEYDFSDQLTGIVGYRWTEDDYDYNFRSAISIYPEDVTGPTIELRVPPPFEFQDDKETGLWSARAQLNWTFSDDAMLYASWNRGIKGPGFNAPLIPPSDSDIPFDEEVLNAYEIGLKSELFDGKVRLNGAIFYYDYEDFQAFQLIDGVTQVIRNRDADTAGAEFELWAAPVEGLDLMLGATYLDATVEDVEINPMLAKDRTPTLTPDWNVSGMARYAIPAFQQGELAFQADFNYLSSHFFDLANAPVVKEDGYTVVNARVEYLTADQQWSVSVFADNVFDKEYKTWAYDIAALLGTSSSSYGRPRWYGVTVQYNWE